MKSMSRVSIKAKGVPSRLIIGMNYMAIILGKKVRSTSSLWKGGGWGRGLTRIMPHFDAAALPNLLQWERQIFGLFLTQFSPSHTLWDGHREVKYSGKQPQSQYSCILSAADTFRGLFFKIWANNIFLFLKMRGGPDKLEKFSYLGHIDLKEA